MNRIISWEQFSKTGHIEDYLSYIACTREVTEDSLERKEDGNQNEYNYSDRDRFISHADW